MNLATATPREIDTLLAGLDHAYQRDTVSHTRATDALHARVEGRPVKSTRKGVKTWSRSTDEVVTVIREKLTLGEYDHFDREQAEYALDRFDRLTRALVDNRAETDRLEEEYGRRPWSRYFTVPGGHIHSNTRCAGGSIRATTQLTWNPELSGKEVAQAVAELGTRLCSHCFPSAPVEWRLKDEKKKHCAGSGYAPVKGSFRPRGTTGLGTCRECTTTHPLTKWGLVRAHKPATTT